MEKIKTDIFCRYLKAKSPYGTLEGGGNDWFLLDNANTICWCVKSQGRMGPDNGLVDPVTCKVGRRCFKMPD